MGAVQGFGAALDRVLGDRLVQRGVASCSGAADLAGDRAHTGGCFYPVEYATSDILYSFIYFPLLNPTALNVEHII